MGVLSNLQPERVFYYFEEISKIPHGSKNVEQISDYLVAFAQQHHLEYRQDEEKNVVIFKPASAGYEHANTVMLQGHMDMVCAKRPDVTHDFYTDGLKLGIDGDMIHANGTTLGGDDGIAVAYILAILEDGTLEHPAIEAVITVNEEIGLLGAQALDCSDLNSKYLINLDSEAEGILTVGCAGGISVRTLLPAGRMNLEGLVCHLRVEGLIGGHSGAEIHKERANANILMGRILYRISRQTELFLIQIAGGEANNAIPKYCDADIMIESDAVDEVKECIEALRKEIAAEYRAADPDIKLIFEEKGIQKEDVLSYITTEKAIFALNEMPNGVMKMSKDIEGLVQTSLNLGVLKTESDHIYMENSIRSSLESEKYYIADKVMYLMEFLGAECTHTEGYPGWAYNPDSKLRDIMVETYSNMYGKEPVVEAIHAGLECGLISAKMPELDCVSIGPDMEGIHTPEEKLSISSVKRVWEYLLEVLKACK